jgi:repressor LexA
MKELTLRQAELLRAIGRSLRARGYAPTWRELCDALGIKSTNGIHDHLRRVEAKGYLRCDRMKTRAIAITEAGFAWLDADTAAARRPAPEEGA